MKPVTWSSHHSVVTSHHSVVTSLVTMASIQKQMAALEAARAQASANLFGERADTGNVIVTLRDLKGAHHLNGTLATIVANGVAPRKPAAGRMAVRLADQSVISVKYENADPTIAAGTRVAVNPGLMQTGEGGWRVAAELGSVLECVGLKCRISIDGVIGMKPLMEPRAELVEPWSPPLSNSNATLVLEAPFLKQARLIEAAASFVNDARTAQEGVTADARQAGKARLRAAANAALEWRKLENHPGVCSLAALNQLGALRCLLECQLNECSGHSALATVTEAMALLRHAGLFARFPGELMARYYHDCAHLYLAKASLALGYPNLRAERDSYEGVMEDLNFARQYSDWLEDDVLRFNVLNRMVVCLTTFQSPSAPTRVQGTYHPVSVGRSMLADLSTADAALAQYALAARASASGEFSPPHAKLKLASSAALWEQRRNDLLVARATLLRWLGEGEQERTLLRSLILRADEHTSTDVRKRAGSRYNLMSQLQPSSDEACRLHEEIRAMMPPQPDCIACGGPLDDASAGDTLEVGGVKDESAVKILGCLLHVVHASCHRRWGDATVERLGAASAMEAMAVRERCPICLDATPTQLVQSTKSTGAREAPACVECE